MYEEDNKVDYFDGKSTCKKRKCCIDLVLYIISLLLGIVVALIVGSIPAVATALQAVLAALIVLAVLLAIGVLVKGIELLCCKCCK